VVAVVSAPAANRSTRIESNWSSVEIKEFTIIDYVIRAKWKEIDNVVGVGRLPNLSDRPNLPYCEAVILESFRLGNIVPLSLPHLVTGDVKCQGYTIPKGSVIFPCLDSVAHDVNFRYLSPIKRQGQYHSK
jgi:hypothetical protein